MTSSIRLGRVFGIEIDANWSLIFVFALVTWQLAVYLLPQAVPGQPTAVYWITGLVGAVLFYVGLLAHELAHSLVARRNGERVTGITLWLFGGVSQLSGEPANPGVEARITIVGPLTSLVIAVLAAGIAVVAGALGLSGLITELFGWLAVLNVALGVFNLVPAFPLDGGRLLSTFFWWRTGSRSRGVHDAVRVGRFFAFLLIGLGVLEFFQVNVVNGIWLAFLGWFLLSAGASEEASTQARVLLKSVPVSSAMHSGVVTVPDWLTTEQFLHSMAGQHPFTTYPVHDPSGALTGVVRLREVVQAVSSGGGERRLREIAHPVAEVPRARPDEDLEALLDRIGPDLDKRVLVFDGDQLVGILSPADVARKVAERQALAGNGRRAPTGAPR
jgi:Zn-dependent protease/CBS domain-containing protein